MSDTPRVEFALGSEVSLEHFFKSNFARSFVTNCRDSKSLDYELLDNAFDKEIETNTKNNNFFSLVNFENKITNIVTINMFLIRTIATFEEQKKIFNALRILMNWRS